MPPRNIWKLTGASTSATSAVLDFPGVSFGGAVGKSLVRARVLGYTWGTASTVASTGAFCLNIDGVNFLDAVGARYGSTVSNNSGGIGYEAQTKLSAFFNESAGGALQTFLVWGEWT